MRRNHLHHRVPPHAPPITTGLFSFSSSDMSSMLVEKNSSGSLSGEAFTLGLATELHRCRRRAAPQCRARDAWLHQQRRRLRQEAEREEVLQRLHECFVLAVCQYLVGLRDEPPERSLTFLLVSAVKPSMTCTVVGTVGFQARTCVE